MFTDQQLAAFAMLGVSPWSSEKTIQTAWRALVRTYHPDQVAGDKTAANARLSELNQAYDLVLRARAKADALLRERARGRLRRAAKTASPRPRPARPAQPTQPTQPTPDPSPKAETAQTGALVLGFSAKERAAITRARAGFAVAHKAMAAPAVQCGCTEIFA